MLPVLFGFALLLLARTHARLVPHCLEDVEDQHYVGSHDGGYCGVDSVTCSGMRVHCQPLVR